MLKRPVGSCSPKGWGIELPTLCWTFVQWQRGVNAPHTQSWLNSKLWWYITHGEDWQECKTSCRSGKVRWSSVFKWKIESHSMEDRKSYGFGMAWVIDDRIVIFPLIRNYFDESPDIRKHISKSFRDFLPSPGKVGQVSNTPFLKTSPDYSRQIWGMWAYGMLWPSLPLQQLLAWRMGCFTEKPLSSCFKDSGLNLQLLDHCEQ